MSNHRWKEPAMTINIGAMPMTQTPSGELNNACE
jgi:hypothetical protein